MSMPRNRNAYTASDRPAVAAFICVTPLQSLIAQRIIEDQGIKRYLLLFTNTRDKKLSEYYDRLAKNAATAKLLLMNKGRIRNYLAVARLVKEWQQYDVTQIYFGSINSGLVQYLAAQFPKATRFSFDDGTGNILAGSAYHQERKKPLITAIIHGMARGHVTQQQLRDTVKLHFTIYDGFTNIVDGSRLRYLPLLAPPAAVASSAPAKQPAVRIFLGRPGVQDHSSPFYKSYHCALRCIQPDLYLPHPGETRSPGETSEPGNNRYPDMLYVHTGLIAEDYILQQLDRFERIRLYSFSSSALLNLKHLRIDRYVVRAGEVTPRQQEYIDVAVAMGCSLFDCGLDCSSPGSEASP